MAPEPEVSSWLCREPPQSGVRLTVPDGPRSASGLAGLVLKSPSLLSHRVAYVTRCCVTAACKPVASGKTSLWPLVGWGWQVVLRVWAHMHGHGQRVAAGGCGRRDEAGLGQDTRVSSRSCRAPPQCTLGRVVTTAGVGAGAMFAAQPRRDVAWPARLGVGDLVPESRSRGRCGTADAPSGHTRVSGAGGGQAQRLGPVSFCVWA